MQIDWNAQTLTWFENAARYTGYAEKMADLILEHLSTRGSLIDIGCGMALSDLYLARAMQSLTCVDRDARVTAYAEARAKKEGLTNISVYTAPGETLSGQWDHVLCLFHGELDTLVHTYLPLAGESLIAVVHARRMGNIAPDGYKMPKCSSIEETSRYLTEQGLSFTLYEGALEYGQPLASKEEGLRFLSAYARPDTPESALHDALQTRLVATGREDFPYYLPSLKEFGLYTIRR